MGKSEKKQQQQVMDKPPGAIFRENVSDDEIDRLTTSRLINPLAGVDHKILMEMGAAFAREKGLEEFTSEFEKGALVAQAPEAFERLAQLSEEDKVSTADYWLRTKALLRREYTHKWHQPSTLYWQVAACSVAAAVQGMDESVINGALLFFPEQFGISTIVGPGVTAAQAANNQWLVGLVTSAPYLCCAVLGCWLTDPLNAWLGRRGTIFLTATISAVTVIWSACTNTWWHLFIARFFLGLGIGPKSATVPIFAAECAPATIRGALVAQWQTWTAFGIFFGTAADLVFLNVRDPTNVAITGLNWRIMLASAALPALMVMAQVMFVPESPRWLISKGRYVEAYDSLCKYRNSPLQAARDLFFINCLLEEEAKVFTGRSRLVELFAVGRNRRAAYASGILMFMQQFCGINVIAYYSSTIFQLSGFSVTQALEASLGFGALNFVFVFPALLTIDTYGRRFLLLTTFPLMAIFLLMTGFAFYIQDPTTRVAVVALGIYLHCISYSPGEGPVPFTYSAEAFPLHVRDLGMSLATAICWLFNFIVALTFPRLLTAFTEPGAFGWYAAWNVLGWFGVLLFVPETKALSLEELDQVFSVPSGQHAAYQLRQVPYWFQTRILRRNMGPQEILYHWDENVSGEAAPIVKSGTMKQTKGSDSSYVAKGEEQA